MAFHHNQYGGGGQRPYHEGQGRNGLPLGGKGLGYNAADGKNHGTPRGKQDRHGGHVQQQHDHHKGGSSSGKKGGGAPHFSKGGYQHPHQQAHQISYGVSQSHMAGGGPSAGGKGMSHGGLPSHAMVSQHQHGTHTPAGSPPSSSPTGAHHGSLLPPRDVAQQHLLGGGLSGGGPGGHQFLHPQASGGPSGLSSIPSSGNLAAAGAAPSRLATPGAVTVFGADRGSGVGGGGAGNNINSYNGTGAMRVGATPMAYSVISPRGDHGTTGGIGGGGGAPSGHFPAGMTSGQLPSGSGQKGGAGLVGSASAPGDHPMTNSVTKKRASSSMSNVFSVVQKKIQGPPLVLTNFSSEQRESMSQFVTSVVDALKICASGIQGELRELQRKIVDGGGAGNKEPSKASTTSSKDDELTAVVKPTRKLMKEVTQARKKELDNLTKEILSPGFREVLTELPNEFTDTVMETVRKDLVPHLFAVEQRCILQTLYGAEVFGPSPDERNGDKDKSKDVDMTDAASSTDAILAAVADAAGINSKTTPDAQREDAALKIDADILEKNRTEVLGVPQQRRLRDPLGPSPWNKETAGGSSSSTGPPNSKNNDLIAAANKTPEQQRAGEVLKKAQEGVDNILFVTPQEFEDEFKKKMQDGKIVKALSLADDLDKRTFLDFCFDRCVDLPDDSDLLFRIPGFKDRVLFQIEDKARKLNDWMDKIRYAPKDRQLIHALGNVMDELIKEKYHRVWAHEQLKNESYKELKTYLLKMLAMVLTLCSSVNIGDRAHMMLLKKVFFKVDNQNEDRMGKWLEMMKRTHEKKFLECANRLLSNKRFAGLATSTREEVALQQRKRKQFKASGGADGGSHDVVKNGEDGQNDKPGEFVDDDFDTEDDEDLIDDTTKDELSKLLLPDGATAASASAIKKKDHDSRKMNWDRVENLQSGIIREKVRALLGDEKWLDLNENFQLYTRLVMLFGEGRKEFLHLVPPESLLKLLREHFRDDLLFWPQFKVYYRGVKTFVPDSFPTMIKEFRWYLSMFPSEIEFKQGDNALHKFGGMDITFKDKENSGTGKTHVCFRGNNASIAELSIVEFLEKFGPVSLRDQQQGGGVNLQLGGGKPTGSAGVGGAAGNPNIGIAPGGVNAANPMAAANGRKPQNPPLPEVVAGAKELAEILRKQNMANDAIIEKIKDYVANCTASPDQMLTSKVYLVFAQRNRNVPPGVLQIVQNSNFVNNVPKEKQVLFIKTMVERPHLIPMMNQYIMGASTATLGGIGGGGGSSSSSSSGGGGGAIGGGGGTTAAANLAAALSGGMGGTNTSVAAQLQQLLSGRGQVANRIQMNLAGLGGGNAGARGNAGLAGSSAPSSGQMGGGKNANAAATNAALSNLLAAKLQQQQQTTSNAAAAPSASFQQESWVNLNAPPSRMPTASPPGRPTSATDLLGGLAQLGSESPKKRQSSGGAPMPAAVLGQEDDEI